jgi:hypothetical protein
MNRSLSFRKESIQESSKSSEAMKQSMDTQGLKVAREQKPFSFTVTFTATL